MRGLKVYSAILVTVIFLFFGVIYWPSLKTFNEKKLTTQNAKQEKKRASLEEQEVMDLELAETYYKNGEYDKAFQLIAKYEDSLKPTNGSTKELKKASIGEEWLDLLVKVAEKTFELEQLVLIQEYYPEVLQRHERASLLVAEHLNFNGRSEEYEALRKSWKGHESLHSSWALLDADYFFLQGNLEEGHRLLERKLEGPEEVARLLKLSLLSSSENPQKAIHLLNEVLSIDPNNIDAFLYKAKLYEKLSDKKSVLKTFQKSLIENPSSILMRSELADFYLREKNYGEALKTFREALKITSKEEESLQSEMALRLYFFEKVVTGQKSDLSQNIAKNDRLKPLMHYLLKLEKEEFFNEESFSKLSYKKEYVKNEQALYWLILLEALKNQDVENAFTLLLNNPFKEVSYDSLLEFAFLQTLNFQKTGELLPVKFEFSASMNKEDLHPLFRSLTEEDPLTVEIQTLLNSQEAFSSLLLANKWTESALTLHHFDQIPDSFPSFLKVELAQAIRKNRGEKEALVFIDKQIKDAKLTLLKDEIKARIALNEGQKEVAEEIYIGIQKSSYEAKSYLARKAFLENDFNLAEELIRDLLQKYPDNPLLLENLKKLEEKKST